MQCFQLTRQCGMKAFPGGGGPSTRRSGPPRKCSPSPTGFDGQNLVTSGSHNQDRTGKANGAHTASAQAVVLGRDCGAVSETQNLQVAWNVGGW